MVNVHVYTIIGKLRIILHYSDFLILSFQIKKPSLKYEYDEKLEETYMFSLKRAFKRSLTDGFFTFLIYDAVNDQLRSYADIWNFARQSNFQVSMCYNVLLKFRIVHVY